MARVKKVKQKTHKGLAKRLRLTKSGKVKRQQAGRGHLMSHKSGDRVRKLRKPKLVAGKIAKTYAYLLSPGR